MKLAELKQIIREALLNEVSYKEAQQSLDSKKFKKMIKRWYEPYKDSIRPKVGLEEPATVNTSSPFQIAIGISS